MLNLEQLCLAACDAARGAGAFILAQRQRFSPSDIESKSHNNFVSYVDKEAERQIVAALRKALPQAGFITEEGTAGGGGNERYKWVIDPLDGTTNFIHGMFPYSTSIALMDGSEVAAGVVYEVGLDECYYAYKGSPAYCNGKVIRVSDAAAISDSLIITGFPYQTSERYKPFMDMLFYLQPDSHGLRRLGSAAVDLAYIACGRGDAFFQYALYAWDVAAGALIVQRAGGIVTDFDGGGNYVFGKEIIAANPKVHPELLQMIQKYIAQQK
jgi:myo-inositol-1(or 4)-monophosphatase